MLLNLTDISSEPLQQQIIRQVRAKILTGELPSGQGLPSIRTLARQARVSVITVQRAYEELVRESLIQSRRGKGFFVAELPRDRKKDIARRRVLDAFGPLIRGALADGLDEREIIEVVTQVLHSKPSVDMREE